MSASTSPAVSAAIFEWRFRFSSTRRRPLLAALALRSRSREEGGVRSVGMPARAFHLAFAALRRLAAVRLARFACVRLALGAGRLRRFALPFAPFLEGFGFGRARFAIDKILSNP